MRIEQTRHTLSWIPSEAVTGMNKAVFESGFTHYDDAAARRPRRPRRRMRAPTTGSGSRTGSHAWIEVDDGRIVDAGYVERRRDGRDDGAPRQRRIATLRRDRLFPSCGADPEIGGRSVRFVQTVGGRTALPAPRRVNHPPFVQFEAPIVWTTLALTLHADGRAELRAGRREPVPPPLGVRQRGQARRQGRAHRLQGVVAARVRQAHALGRRGLAGARHRGRDRARARAVDARSCAAARSRRSAS